MKVTIEYDGDEEREELQSALDGSSWKIAMWQLDQNLRGIVKHAHFNGREATSAEINAAEKLREEIRRVLGDYNLILE
jgi:hypothetical protein